MALISAMEYVYPPALWRNQDPLVASNAPVNKWFAREWAIDIPESQIGWMLSQGWVVNDVTEDEDKPPKNIYNLYRDKFKAQSAMADLLNSYVVLFNEARVNNDARYDDVITVWSDALSKTQSHMDRASAAHNAYEVLFLNSLDSIVGTIDSALNLTNSGAAAAFNDAEAALNTFASSLAQLGSGYTSYSGAIGTILSTQTSSLSQYTTRVAAMLTQLAADYTGLLNGIDALETADDTTLASHVTAYEAKLDALETAVTTVQAQLLALVNDAEDAYEDYRTPATTSISAMESELTNLNSDVDALLDSLDTAIDGQEATVGIILALFLSEFATHETTTRALLVDLGVTELARINEDSDNKLARTRQLLVDRGFYSSTLVAQTDARIERERTEAIGALNDKLAREKVTNEHTLQGQRVAARDRQLDGEKYLHALNQEAIKYRAEWSARLFQSTVELHKTVAGLHGTIRDARMQFISMESGVRDRVFGWGRDATKAVAEGKAHVYQLRRALTQWKSDSRFKVADALRSVRASSSDLYGKELAARNSVDAFAAKAQEQLMTLLNGYIGQYGEGVARYAAMTIQNGRSLADIRLHTISEAMRTRMAFATGLTEANNATQKLLAYQIDARNNLAVGLFRMMGERKDPFPEVQEFGSLIVGMSGSGAAKWVAQ